MQARRRGQDSLVSRKVASAPGSDRLAVIPLASRTGGAASALPERCAPLSGARMSCWLAISRDMRTAVSESRSSALSCEARRESCRGPEALGAGLGWIRTVSSERLRALMADTPSSAASDPSPGGPPAHMPCRDVSMHVKAAH